MSLNQYKPSMYAQIFVCKRNLTEHFPFFNRLVRLFYSSIQAPSGRPHPCSHCHLEINVEKCTSRDEFLYSSLSLKSLFYDTYL